MNFTAGTWLRTVKTTTVVLWYDNLLSFDTFQILCAEFANENGFPVAYNNWQPNDITLTKNSVGTSLAVLLMSLNSKHNPNIPEIALQSQYSQRVKNSNSLYKSIRHVLQIIQLCTNKGYYFTNCKYTSKMKHNRRCNRPFFPLWLHRKQHILRLLYVLGAEQYWRDGSHSSVTFFTLIVLPPPPKWSPKR